MPEAPPVMRAVLPALNTDAICSYFACLVLTFCVDQVSLWIGLCIYVDDVLCEESI